MIKIKAREILIRSEMKITPQRIAILESVFKLNNHPTAEMISERVRKNHPNIAIGTIYNTLELFVKKGVIKKVKTDKDIMRYDPVTQPHHHLYCAESDRIEDYVDADLNNLIEQYFKKKKIENFDIKDIKLQIIGNFKDILNTNLKKK